MAKRRITNDVQEQVEQNVDISSIVTPHHLEQLNKALDLLMQVQRLVTLGRKAGQPVADFEKQQILFTEKILQRKRAYFPEEP